jgi:hypothetical protein
LERKKKIRRNPINAIDAPQNLSELLNFVEQDPDPERYQSEKSDPDSFQDGLEKEFQNTGQNIPIQTVTGT